MDVKPPDSFQLYDLRVEVICPEGERILCGAKAGDYFTLEGEMLYLPPGQGFSIYSLGEFTRVNTSESLSSSDIPFQSGCTSPPCGQAENDPSQ